MHPLRHTTQNHGHYATGIAQNLGHGKDIGAISDKCLAVEIVTKLFPVHFIINFLFFVAWSLWAVINFGGKV